MHATTRTAESGPQLALVLAISSAMFLAEIATGLLTNSLALIADAWHVFTDIAGIALALGAVWFSSRPATERRTFGSYRLEILAAVVNAVLLVGVAAYVVLEAWRRLGAETVILSGPMLAVAAVGLAANLVSMRLLRPHAAHSLNVRGAYLEVAGDTLSSLAVIAAAVVIALTGLTAADAIASAFIGVLILPRTWSLLREAVDVLLEATPRGIDMTHVRQHIIDAPGVVDVHDLHAWTITSGMPVLSAHVVLAEGSDAERALDVLSACLADHFDIEHSTFQLETGDRRIVERTSHH